MDPGVTDPVDRLDPELDESTHERILRSALLVFSEVGYARATIKRIAEEAEIRSTALLYWYHPNKEALFKAVADRYAPVLDRVSTGDDLASLAPEAYFGKFATRFLRAFLDPDVQRVYRMLAQEPDLLAKAIPLEAHRPNNVFTLVEQYLGEQMEAGTIREVDAASTAAAFVGTLTSYLMAAGGRTPWAPRPVAPETFVRTTAAIFARGLATPMRR
jgi:AcrR family transcriptional regulator